jgi:hypothetical protein
MEFVLKNPKAADDLLEESELKIGTLFAFPGKFPIVDDPLPASWGIRFVQIKNYLAFFMEKATGHLF